MDIDRLEKPSRIEYTFVEDSIALDSLAELNSCKLFDSTFPKARLFKRRAFFVSVDNVRIKST